MQRYSISGKRRAAVMLLLLAACLALVAVSAFARPNSRDEGQYVAAVALMRIGLPFRDFPFLQTPLQPLLLSPLAYVSAGWLLATLRAVNALFALATASILALQLRNRVRFSSAAIAVASLVCTEEFLFAAGQARNDALPMLLLSAGQWLMLRAVERPEALRRTLFGAFFFGLAISTKISAALPAAGAGVYWLLRFREQGPRPVLALAAGTVVGLFPCVVLWAIAPSQFLFGVFLYSLDAPAQWWTSIGAAEVLRPSFRIAHLMLLSLRGVIGIGVAAALLDRTKSPARRMLDCMLLAALVGAYMPEPAFEQYLVPVLPAVVARFAFALDSFKGRRRQVVGALAMCASIAGLTTTVHYAIFAERHGADLVRTVANAQAAAAVAQGRVVVTLSPERLAGRNINLDRRFAAGPFLFRTFGTLSDIVMMRTGAPNWERVEAALDAAPPGVVIVGGESASYRAVHRPGLDGYLQAWAIRHGYHPEQLAGGQLTAYSR